jgi:outer membrane protein assembly factor BamB
LLLAHDAPLLGRLGWAGKLLVATIDRRSDAGSGGHGDQSGIGAFDSATGQERWSIWGTPPLAAATADTIYAYSRSGLVVALNPDGSERWRRAVPDDRSAAARERGDRDAPFVADVLPAGETATLAAGAEVLRLSAADGSVLARAPAARGSHGVVARIAPAAGGAVVATCTERSDADDAGTPAARELWQTPPSPESLRTAPGDVVAFRPDLRQSWRLPPPVPGIVYGDLAPAAAGDAVILAGALTQQDGASRYLSLAHDRIVAVDAQAGTLRWVRDMPGGRGHVDPVVVDGGVVAGYEPVNYRIADGVVAWHVRPGRPKLDPRIAPVVAGDRLLYAAEGALVAVRVDDGSASVVARLGPPTPRWRVTTTLLLSGSTLYLGVRAPERPAQVLAVHVPAEA